MADNEGLGKKKWEQWWQLASLLIGIVAIIITVVFAFRAEREKKLGIIYQPPLQLVSMEGNQRVGLQVSLAGRVVQSPWLVSVRVTNSGNEPIEARDVEMPLQLTFAEGGVISAQVSNASQPGIYAKASYAGNVVTIDNKLLNPGDWITFDVLFDGEPKVPPQASVRISGVSAIEQTVLSGEQKRVYLTLGNISKEATFIILLVASLGGVAMLVASIAISREEWKSFRRGVGLTESQVMGTLRPQRAELRALHALVKIRSVALLDSHENLRTLLQKDVPAGVLAGLGLAAADAAKALAAELKGSLRAVLAERVFRALPGGLDKSAKLRVLQVDIENGTARNLFDTAQNLLAPADRPIRRAFVTLMPALLFVLVSLSVVLTLGGSWRTAWSLYGGSDALMAWLVEKTSAGSR